MYTVIRIQNIEIFVTYDFIPQVQSSSYHIKNSANNTCIKDNDNKAKCLSYLIPVIYNKVHEIIPIIYTEIEVSIL